MGGKKKKKVGILFLKQVTAPQKQAIQIAQR